MRQIQLVTFKGCQSTIDFRNKLEDLIDTENLDATVEMILVSSPNEAEKMELFGSPTIRIDGVELQQERRGPAGFY
jgi:hypothetical protein